MDRSPILVGAGNDVTSMSTATEHPIFFRAGDETLFGVLTEPTSGSLGTALVLLPGGGYLGSTNRNRLSVRLCRQAANGGYHALRFDYHGVGESTGVVERFSLDQPFVDDLLGAVDFLERQDIGQFVIAGTCFGARTALAAAASIQGLVSVILISPPVRDFAMGDRKSTRLASGHGLIDHLRRALRPHVMRGLVQPNVRRRYARLVGAALRQRAAPRRAAPPYAAGDGSPPRSPDFVSTLESLVSREVRILILFGTDEDLYDDFERARSGRLGPVLRRAGSLVRVETFPGHVHGFSTIEVQDWVTDTIARWLSDAQPSAIAGETEPWISR